MDDTERAGIGGDFAPVRSAAVYAVELDGELVLLDERADRLHLLNRSAALVWRCLDGRVTLDALAQELSDELGVEYEPIRAEVLAVVGNLVAEKLVT